MYRRRTTGAAVGAIALLVSAALAFCQRVPARSTDGTGDATAGDSRAATLTEATGSPAVAPRLGERHKVAIVPFGCDVQVCHMGDADVPATKLVGELSHALVTRLSQSVEFEVLDRDYLAQLMGERRLSVDFNTGPADQVKVGQRLGADYLLVGHVQEAGVTRTTGVSRLTGKPKTVRHGLMTVQFRMVNVATGRDHWADTYRRAYGDAELLAAENSRTPVPLDDLLTHDAGSGVADQVIGRAFPVRVDKVQNPDRGVPLAILDQGGLSFSTGQTFTVYELGRTQADPGTNALIEREEIEFACLEVVRTSTALAYARFIRGDPSDRRLDHAICRPYSDPSSRFLQRPAAAGPASVGVVAVCDGDEFDRDLAEQVGQTLREVGVGGADAGMFTDALVADGLFQQLFDAPTGGARPPDAAAGFAARCRYILLADKDEDLAPNHDAQDEITGHGTLRVRVIRTSDWACVDQFSTEAAGSGWKLDRAQRRLDETLAVALRRHGFGEWLGDAQARGPKAEGNDAYPRR